MTDRQAGAYMRPQPLILPPSPVDDAWIHQAPRAAAQPRRRRSRLRLWGCLTCTVAALLLVLLQLRLAGRWAVHHMHDQITVVR